MVATPIGNSNDITQRALSVLQSVDYLFCEETKPGYRLIRSYGIKSDVDTLNEHNESEKLKIIGDYLADGKDVAYFSDAGTPVLADPGFKLIQYIRSKKGIIKPIPGVCSIITALSVSPFPIDRFFYFGFLSNKAELRETHLKELKQIPYTTVVLETPYRLARLIDELAGTIKRTKKLCLCSNLTTDKERFDIGYCSDIKAILSEIPPKCPFVMILSPLLP